MMMRLMGLIALALCAGCDDGVSMAAGDAVVDSAQDGAPDGMIDASSADAALDLAVGGEPDMQPPEDPFDCAAFCGQCGGDALFDDCPAWCDLHASPALDACIRREGCNPTSTATCLEETRCASGCRIAERCSAEHQVQYTCDPETCRPGVADCLEPLLDCGAVGACRLTFGLQVTSSGLPLRATGARKTVTITNSGRDATEPIEVEVTGDVDAIAVSTDACDGAMLAGDEQCEIVAELRAVELGRYQVRLTARSLDVSAVATVNAELEAPDAPAQIGVVDPVIDFGEVAGVEEIPISILNTGGSPSGPVQVLVMNPGVAFDVTGGCVGQPIGAGEACRLTASAYSLPGNRGPAETTAIVRAEPGGEIELTLRAILVP